jgi:hypothetical protein
MAHITHHRIYFYNTLRSLMNKEINIKMNTCLNLLKHEVNLNKILKSGLYLTENVLLLHSKQLVKPRKEINRSSF